MKTTLINYGARLEHLGYIATIEFNHDWWECSIYDTNGAFQLKWMLESSNLDEALKEVQEELEEEIKHLEHRKETTK